MSIDARLRRLETQIEQEDDGPTWSLDALTADELRRLRDIRVRVGPAGPERFEDLSEDDQLFLADVRRKCVKAV